jgi:hypothetical protein
VIKFDTVMQRIIESVNAYLTDNRYEKPLCIYENLGMAVTDYVQDGSNTVVSKLYGVYRNQTSQISTISDGLNMLAATAVIDLLVDAVQDEDGSFPEVNDLVSLLNEIAAIITGQYASIEENGIIYAVLPVMSPATVGPYQEGSSNWGAYVPVSMQIAFTALEGAATPASQLLYLDGRKIPTTELITTRTKTATTDVPANSSTGATSNSDDSSTLEIQLACPVISGYTDMITDELYSGESNVPHVAVIKDRTKSAINKCYLVELTKIQQTKQSNATIGLNVNLLELNPETANFPTDGSWKHLTVTTESDTLKATVNVPAGVWCVFWGDGTSNVINANSGTITLSRAYKRAGTYQVHMYRWLGDIS